MAKHSLCVELKQIAINHSVGNYDRMRYIALILMLIAPSWAAATQRGYVCTAKAAIGWEAKSQIYSVGEVTTENQWLLSPIDKIEMNFSDPEKEPMTASHALKLLGEVDVKGYCRSYINESTDYHTANCLFLNEMKKYKGTLSSKHSFAMETSDDDGLIYKRIDETAFNSVLNLASLSEQIVAYEVGFCKKF